MNLKKPLAYFDLETTGTNTQTDKIVSIAIIKSMPDGSEEEKHVLLNPGMPIPPGATEVHGITDEMVSDKPLFKQISKGLASFLYGCDFAGFNSDIFDVPMLIMEFHRAGVSFPTWSPNFIDVYKIEKRVNSHKLTDTYERYTNEKLLDAHDAMVDTRATKAVLFNQIRVLKNIISSDTTENIDFDVEFLDDYGQGDKKRFDYAGKCYLDGEVVKWAFGKNQHSDVLEDRGYLNWVINSDFPIQTKDKLKELLTNKNQ